MLFEQRQQLREECGAVAEQIRAAERDLAQVRGDLAEHADELSFAQGEKSDTLSTCDSINKQ